MAFITRINNSIIVYTVFYILCTYILAAKSSDSNVTPSTIRTLNLNKVTIDNSLHIPEFISNFLPISDQIDNDECRRHSLEILEGIKKFDIWALRSKYQCYNI
jgi:hypothetical protein